MAKVSLQSVEKPGNNIINVQHKAKRTYFDRSFPVIRSGTKCAVHEGIFEKQHLQVHFQLSETALPHKELFEAFSTSSLYPATTSGIKGAIALFSYEKQPSMFITRPLKVDYRTYVWDTKLVTAFAAIICK